MKLSSQLIALGLLALPAIGAAETWPTVAPGGKVTIVAEQTARNGLSYSVWLDGKRVIDPSRLGIVKGGRDITGGATLADVHTRSINTPYSLKAGKKLAVTDRCEETTLKFNGFDIIFRAYDEGVAFRYRLDGSARPDTIEAEMTEFAVPLGGKAWIHPYDWNDRKKPSYEQYCSSAIAVNTPCAHGRGWGFPMLFSNPDGTWSMVTEAHIDGTFPATHVDNSGAGASYRVRFPEADEATIPDDPRPVVGKEGLYTPWRVIMVGDGVADIFANQMVSHLNPAPAFSDTDWIKPGRAAWSWWYDGQSPRSYAQQLKYVDLCREMGWEYSLIDAGWQNMDGDGVKGVCDYAARTTGGKVGIWLWYHSGSGVGADAPEQRRIMCDPSLRRAEMERISKMGVKGIKVDFFDTDKQRTIALYPQILKDAADFHLLVDLHGATHPRGFERTYPNLMTTEGIRGAETLGRQERCERAAEHNATVPFTRNVVGSMDYTPVTFSNKVRQGVPAIRRTSLAHQLALSVVFESGFQCFADRAEAYLALPKAPKEFLKAVPAAWDESRLLDGYPAEYAVVGRRIGNTWFVGAVNGKTSPRTVTFRLPEGCEGKQFTVIGDGKDINSFATKKVKSNADGTVTVEMLGNGGFSAVIK